MTFDPKSHLIKVRGGGEYLEAKWRLVWLRDEHPDAIIETQHIDIDLEKNHAIFRATVTIPDKGSATGYGSESSKDFGDFIEKAETKALARALAALGYGTQFTGDELSEGERIVDSPVQRPPSRNRNVSALPPDALPVGAPTPEPTPHPKVQAAIDERESNWKTAIEGAATIGELREIGKEIEATGYSSESLRQLYVKHRERLQDKALA